MHTAIALAVLALATWALTGSVLAWRKDSKEHKKNDERLRRKKKKELVQMSNPLPFAIELWRPMEWLKTDEEHTDVLG